MTRASLLRCLLLIVYVVPAGLASAAQAAEQPEALVLARFTGGEVTAADLERYLAAQPYHLQGPNEATASLLEWTRTQVRDVVFQREMLRRAKAENLAATDEAQARLAKIELDVQTREASAVVDEMATPTEEEMREFYWANPTSFDLKEEFRFHYVFANGADKGWERAEERINQAYRELEEGKEFEDVARRYCDSGRRQEELGKLRAAGAGQLSATVEAVLRTLKPGNYSAPVRTQYGFHIFLLDEHRPARKVPFEEARKTIENRLRAERVQSIRTQIERDLQGSNAIEIFPEVLEDDNVYPYSVVARMGGHEMLAQKYVHTLKHVPPVERTPERLRELRAGFIESATQHLLAIAAAKHYNFESDRPGFAERLARAQERELARFQEELEVERRLGTPTEAELRACYMEHRRYYAKPREVLGRSLEIAYNEPEDATYRDQYLAREAAREAAELLRAQLLDGADFAALARSHSTAANATQGGSLGWARSHGYYFDTRTEGLEKGGISEVVALRDSWAIFQVADVRPETMQPFEAVREEVADDLADYRRLQLGDLLRKEVEASLGLVYDEAAIRKQVDRMFPDGIGDLQRATLSVKD